MFEPADAAFVTDLYQLTMMAAYRQNRRCQRATFEGFVRKLPTGRGFLLAAGLERVVEYLLSLRFTGTQIDWLRRLPQFAAVEADFWEYLSAFRFRGDVWALPEGTAFFANEPVLRVEADIPEAQLPETFALTVMNIATLAATKTARVVHAAAGRPVTELGLRRAHGPEAGIAAARAAYIGGAAATSNVYAGWRLGIPVTGTMAHAWVQSHDDEAAAFAEFARVFPDHTTALVDTYDTLQGSGRAAKLGVKLSAVRLDSGDLAELSRKVRALLDSVGCGATKIVVSNDLNEHAVAELVAAGAPIDVFGVGTDLVVSRDAPALSYVYKLVQTVEPDGRVTPRIKLAAGKASWPTAKQIWRRIDAAGRFVGDVLASASEAAPTAPVGGRVEPLLVPILRAGELVAALPTLSAIRERATAQVAALPEDVRRLTEPATYPVEPSPAVRSLYEQLSAARR